MAESFREAGHLPKQRAGGEPASPHRLPRQRRGITPQLHGRYPEYDVLSQAQHWDPVTRKVVTERVADVPPITFFDEREARTLRAFCDVVLAQDAEPRVPVLEMIDQKMAARQLDGFRHHDLPEDPETWKRVAAGLDEASGGSFTALTLQEQREIVRRFADGELRDGVWADLPAPKAWSVVMRGVLSAFYSHPWTWNEIGYGGPRYPRGYLRLGVGRREPRGGSEAFATDPVPDTSERGDT